MVEMRKNFENTKIQVTIGCAFSDRFAMAV